MADTLDHVEGIGEAYAAKLADAGIKNTDELLEKGATKEGRASLAETAGVSESLILEWVNHCDLMRINGVGSEYSDLLEAAGVDTVPELAQRVPENLHAKLEEVNNEKELVRSLPTPEAVAEWVTEAKDLPRIIEH